MSRICEVISHEHDHTTRTYMRASHFPIGEYMTSSAGTTIKVEPCHQGSRPFLPLTNGKETFTSTSITHHNPHPFYKHNGIHSHNPSPATIPPHQQLNSKQSRQPPPRTPPRNPPLHPLHPPQPPKPPPHLPPPQSPNHAPRAQPHHLHPQTPIPSSDSSTLPRPPDQLQRSPQPPLPPYLSARPAHPLAPPPHLQPGPPLARRPLAAPPQSGLVTALPPPRRRRTQGKAGPPPPPPRLVFGVYTLHAHRLD